MWWKHFGVEKVVYWFSYYMVGIDQKAPSLLFYIQKTSVRALREGCCIRVDVYLIWSSFLITTYQPYLPHDARLRKPPPKSDHEKKKPTLFPSSAITIHVSLSVS